MDEKADIIASKKGQTEEQKMKRAITGKMEINWDV